MYVCICMSPLCSRTSLADSSNTGNDIIFTQLCVHMQIIIIRYEYMR